MNIIRTIESATLLSIGAFCAAAVVSIVMQSAQAMPSSGTNAYNDAASTHIQTVVVSARRLSAAEKAKFAKTQA